MNTTTSQSDIQLAQWRAQLVDGLAQMQIEQPPARQQQLLDYLALLVKWNKVFNLTAIRDPAEMVSRQLLDSLSILSWVRGPRVLDVGTGAGLPGIPLAIVRPDIEFTLLDSNGKKTRFVQQAAAELGLANVAVRKERIENLDDPQGFNDITSRAFAALVDFVEASTHLLAPGGHWLAMRGLAEKDGNTPPSGVACRLHPLQVAGATGRRHLLECRRES